MLTSVENNIELFDKVDKNDVIIEVWLKESELHINDDITRVVTTYVFTPQWKLYIAQRSPEKVVDPLKYEAPSHGRVNSGETYEDAAKRETMEELWIDVNDLEEVKHYYTSFNTNVWLRQHYKKLFIGKIFQEPIMNEIEIYNIKSFDNISDFLYFYDNNTDLFSDAIWYDLNFLRKYFNM